MKHFEASFTSIRALERRQKKTKMTNRVRLSTSFALLALALSFANADDPSPLQDICVAVKEPMDALFVNGKFCKNPSLTTADDFLFSGLQVPRCTANPVGSTITKVWVDQLPGLNTLGISMVRIDFGIGGLNPPHFHPRASEILLVLEGTLYAGFVTTNQLNNTFYEKVLYPGDAFVFPLGMIHFQLNVGKTRAVAIANFNSQYPGVMTIGNALFNAKPPIFPEVLAKGFQVDEEFVETLQEKLWYYN